MSKVWFITGAARGIGLALAKQALLAGETVVATGRSTGVLVEALGENGPNLLNLALDVTAPGDAQNAGAAAMETFGRIDVLVNNAGYAQLGVFEDASADEVRQQFLVNVFGAMEVTRAVLPIMRAQRSGRVFNISSIAGLRGSLGASLYCSSKFALEGWSESLAQELEPFGIAVTAVEPGFFRTDFLDPKSVRYAGGEGVPEYREAVQKLRSFFDERSHQQAGDPVKLAKALLQLAGEAEPPTHFLAGTDAIAVLEERIERDRKELQRWRTLSSSTDIA